MGWAPITQRPTAPDVYLTRRPDGLKLWRRFDGRRWHYGDPFKSNTEGFRRQLPPGMPEQVIEGWKN